MDIKPAESTFTLVDIEFGAGTPIPDGWQPITACDLLIFVGLTGVGKTTVLKQLEASLTICTLLPDRRTLTDVLMIPDVQQKTGQQLEAVADRQQRFELTRMYREEYPGGMAHALSQVALSSVAAEALVIFDGLRGENEIHHAASLLPYARFLMLDAPVAVRIQRLLTRHDAFDAIAGRPAVDTPTGDTSSLPALDVPELSEILTDEEQQTLLSFVKDGDVAAEELSNKARIVLAERRNYNPAATREALQEYAPERSLILDTGVLSPEAIVSQAICWLRA